MRNFIVITAMAFAVLSTGCDKKESGCGGIVEVDYYFLDMVGIIVKDADGNNLLDAGFDGNILSQEITVEFKGETYSVESESVALEPQSDPALWVGEYGIDPDAPTALIFGRLYHLIDEETQELVVNWGDETSDEISFEYKITWSWNERDCKFWHEAVEESKILLNGTLVSEDSLIVEIVK